MTKWPEGRLADERLVIYRVVIQADVAGTMGVDSVLNDIGDIFEEREAWDVFDVDVQPRDVVVATQPDGHGDLR